MAIANPDPPASDAGRVRGAAHPHRAGDRGGTSLTWLTSSSNDRLAVISNFLSFGTLLLALIAGIVALAAYSAATGLPDLRVQIQQPPLDLPNLVAFSTDPVDTGMVSVVVENTSAYAARSPAVVIEFRQAYIGRRMYAASTAWTPIVRDFNSSSKLTGMGFPADYLACSPGGGGA